MNGSYATSSDIEHLSEKISASLCDFGDAVCPVVLVDRTCFSGQGYRIQTDTYQIMSYMERGYITVNIHFFQPDFAVKALSVKIAVFPPVNDTSRKARKIFDSLESLVLNAEG